jgi:hypothetical protein
MLANGWENPQAYYKLALMLEDGKPGVGPGDIGVARTNRRHSSFTSFC